MAHERKNLFFQSPRYRYTNPTTEKETSNQCQLGPKTFQDHLRRLRDSCKNLAFCPPKTPFCGIFHSKILGRAKIKIFTSISDTPQVVLKRFGGLTNISLMFLFPWLDQSIDISDFEKIDSLAHKPFLAFSPQQCLGSNSET